MIKDRPHYYVRNPSRDDRTRLARVIDVLLSLLLVWLLAALAVQTAPVTPVLSGILTVPALALGTLLVLWYHRHKNKSHRQHRDIWYSARKCRQKLKEMESPGDFALLVKELMQGTLPVTGLKVLPPGDDSAISLTGYIRNRRVGVMCINSGIDDHKTTTAEIRKFFAEVKQAGFHTGIVVTTGSFSDDARRFASRVRGQVQIHLLDGHTVLRMARKANHPVFPDEKWHEEQESRISGLEMALSIKENIMFSRRKAWSFILLGIIFTVISALQTGITGTVYLVAGVINLFAGFPGLILSYLRKHELLMDWR